MAAQQVRDGFVELYGTEPEGVWSAPGRVNLIGEHTDYNDGFVMPFALPHTAVAAVSRRTDGVLRLHSSDVEGGVAELRLDDLAPESDRNWTAYPAGVVWALREAGHPVTGADVHLASTVPAGAGLSSSAALEVVVALALNDLYDLGLQRWQLARLCQRAENVYVGAPTGIMDQTASAACEAYHALFLDTRDLSQKQIPFDLAAEGMVLLVVDTRVKHSHSEGEYGKRRAGCERGAALLGVDALRDIPYAEARRGPRQARRRRGSRTPGPPRRHRGRAGREDRRPAGVGRDPRDRPRAGRQATPRCATTSVSPARSWTWWSTPPSPRVPWVPG